MAAKRPPALDRIDVKILAALQRDGRSTIQKLAADGRALAAGVARAGAAPGSIGRHRRLSGRGRACPPGAAGQRLRRDHPGEAGQPRRASRSGSTAIDEIVECWEVSGTVDYVARFVCADIAAYEELTGDADRRCQSRRRAHRQPRGAAPGAPLRRLSGIAAVPEQPNDRKLTIRRFGRAATGCHRRIPPSPGSTSAARRVAATAYIRHARQCESRGDVSWKTPSSWRTATARTTTSRCRSCSRAARARISGTPPDGATST